MKALAKLLRARADRMIAAGELSRYDADNAELLLVLARILSGKSIDRAFGAPGDWGYGTAIGDALLADLKADTTGAFRIVAERWRQIEREGYDAEHDDTRGHQSGELLDAAISYAQAAAKQARGESLEYLKSAAAAGDFPWPWEQEWWKPSANPIRNLEKAGALIAAEIDRLQRKARREAQPEGSAP